MRSVNDYLITPAGKRYNNTTKVGDKELILNTEMQNHLYVNRKAEVLSSPIIPDGSGIENGDLVLVHHNLFRRFRDVYGKEKNSRAYFSEDKYLAPLDQIYMVNKGNGWEALPGYVFVQTVKNSHWLNPDKEMPLWGIVAYPDKEFDEVAIGDLIGFEPSSEFEFILEGKKLYRVLSKFITVNHGHQAKETAYNPSWTESRR